MIDTHCHLDFSTFDTDREEVIKRAFEGGLEAIIAVACNIERSNKCLEIARMHPKIFSSVGIHPTDWRELKEGKMEEIKALAEKYIDEIIGFGETGLDYHHIKDAEGQDWQKKGLEEHLALGRKYKKPVIVHTREAKEDTLEILENNEIYKAVIHCFSEDLEFARKVLAIPGMMISFTGLISYKKPEHLREVVKEIPLEKIMIETDSPFLTPEAAGREKRNEPLFVKHVAEKIAEIKRIKPSVVIEVTTKNAKSFFNI